MPYIHVPSGTGHVIHQPITIQSEPKKPKPPPAGAHLYNDIFNCYRGFEHLYLFATAPKEYLAGFTVGLIKASIDYSAHGAPKKIYQDGQMIDFGTKVHSSGFKEIFKLFGKRFLLGVYPATNIDKFSDWAARDIQEIKIISMGLKSAFVVYKAAQLSEELIQRLANWIDIPAK